MSSVKVVQVRSSAGASAKQRETLRSLKLGRIGKNAEHADGPQFRGMLKAVEHLVKVEDGEGS
jgi:large subunit ribosomal protein L30